MNRGHLILATLLACGLIGATSLYVFSQDDLFRDAPVDTQNPSARNVPQESVFWPTSGSYRDTDTTDRTVPAADKNFVLEQAVLKLTEQYARTTDSSKRADLATELTQMVEKQFAARQEARSKELELLEQQLRRLRDIHSRREREKQRIVDDRVQQLLRDAEGLGWGPSATGKLRWNSSLFDNAEGSPENAADDLFVPPTTSSARQSQ